MFWDMEPEAGSSLQSLTEENPPNWKAILEDPELFTSFRSKEDFLIKFLISQKNFNHLLEIIASNEIKQQKLVMSLFLGQNSVLLEKLVNSKEDIDKLISMIDFNNCIHLGYLSRLIESMISQFKDKFYTNFDKIAHLPKFIKITNNLAVHDILDNIVFNSDLNSQWPIWCTFRLFVPKITTPQIFEENSQNMQKFYEKIKVIELTMAHRINILKLISKFIINNLTVKSVTDIIHPIVPKLLYATSNPQFLAILLDLAYNLPPSTHTASFAVEIMQKSKQFNQPCISALKYLSKYPSKQTLVSFQSIIDSFLADKLNTFHMEAFLELIKSGMKINDFRKTIIEKMVPIVLDMAQAQKQRKNLPISSFLLEIGLIIDQHVENNEKWAQFRSKELALYKTKDDIDPTIVNSDKPFDLSKESAIEFEMKPEKLSEMYGAGHDKKEPEEKTKEAHENKIEFPSFEENAKTGENSLQNQKIEFPSFEETEKPTKIEFPSFEEVKDSKSEEQSMQNIQFPSFEEVKETETSEQALQNIKFPSFEESNISSEKPTVEFPTENVQFPSFEDNSNISFPSFEENQKPKETQAPTPETIEQYNKFTQMLNDDCWKQQLPDITKLFDIQDKFVDPNESFNFLIKSKW